MKINIGDKVLLVSKKPGSWSNDMNNYLNTTQVITCVTDNSFNFKGSNGWYFNIIDSIEKILTIKEYSIF